MGLFKSSEERKMEREMEIRKGLSRIKKQIRNMEREEQDFIKKAKRARKIGDNMQLKVINIALVPLLLMVISAGLWLVRRRRPGAPSREIHSTWNCSAEQTEDGRLVRSNAADRIGS